MLLVVGFITGILSGLLGIGGGLIFVPLLLTVFPIIGLEYSIITVSSIATSLMAGSFTSASAVYNHQKKQNILWKEGLILGAGAVFSAVIAPHIIISVDQNTLKIIISIFITIAAIKIFKTKTNIQSVKTKLSMYWLFPIGVLLGGLAAISGLGGGIFYVPILFVFIGGDLKISVGTSTIVIFMTMVSATISFLLLNQEWNIDLFQFGYINIASAVLLGLGAVFGAYFGVKLIFKVPVAVFRRIFSVFLILVVIKILLGVINE